jgi:energy-coupling factor transport system permease protein
MIVPAYRRRATPLHAARAGAGAAYCLGLGLVAALAEHPLVIVAALAGVLLAAWGARCLPEIGTALRLGLPLAILIALINPLVSHEGATVLVRGWTLPVLGTMDITAEAVVYGAVLGLRALVLVLAAALYTAAVDPDEILRLVRRVSPRSAMTASVATRMLPVLARDAARVADAQRCRPGEPPSRLALARAVAQSALDRAVDVAAALELRGYGGAGSPARRHRAWSRHDVAFAAAGAVLVLCALAAAFAPAAAFDPYPRLDMATGATTWALCAAIVLAVGLPLLDRRGVAR